MVLNSTIRQVIFWVVIIGGAFLLYRFFNNSPTNQPQQLTYSDLVSKVENKQVKSAIIEKEKVTGKLDTGTSFTTELPNEFVAADLAKAMKDKVEKFEFKSSSSSASVSR
jgi:cell division protease FtsH